MRFVPSVLFAGVLLALTGCTQTSTENLDPATDAPSTVEGTAVPAIDLENLSGEVTIDSAIGPVSYPVNARPLVVFDMSLMQNLAALGVAVDGIPTPYLDNFVNPNLPAPTIIAANPKEPNLEALHALQPAAILTGSRQAALIHELEAIAPVYNLTYDTANIYESSKQRLLDLGKMYNKEVEAASLQADIDSAIARAKAAVGANPGRGLVVMVNGGKISAYNPQSRYGFVHQVFGITPATDDIADANHGMPISFEYIQNANPDWIFVVDRTEAVGQDTENVLQFLDNPLVNQTIAGQKGQIVKLSPDSYLAFGGYYQWIKDAGIIEQAFSQVS